MKHVRFVLLAYLLCVIISAPFLIVAEMMEDYKTFAGACMAHLIIAMYSFPVVSIVFLVDHFIIDLLENRRAQPLNFLKRMGIMLTLGIIYFVITLLGNPIPGVRELLYSFGSLFALFVFFGFIYELTLRITRKYPLERLLSQRKDDSLGL